MILEKKIAQTRKLIEKHEKELDDLLNSCKHPKSKLKEHSLYYEGSYDDRAHTRYWTECSICGKMFEGDIETHNWYG